MQSMSDNHLARYPRALEAAEAVYYLNVPELPPSELKNDSTSAEVIYHGVRPRGRE